MLVEKGGGPGDAPLAPLWAAPWFSQLQELTLTTDQGLGGAGLAPLRAAPLLQKLYIDTFAGAPALSADDGRALAVAALHELRELQLHNVGPGLVAALLAAPWLLRLESIEMTGRREGPGGALAAADGRALAAVQLPSLKRLVLNGMEPGFMAACASAAWLPRLERLNLCGAADPLGGGGGLAEGSTPFTALASLSLYHGGTAPPSEVSRLAALVAAPWFGRLQYLSLGGFPLGTDGGFDGAALRALAAAPLPDLTSLSLYDSCLSAADVSGALSSAPWLAALTSLMIASNPLGAPGHRALSLLHLPRLRALSLGCNGFDGTGLAALVCAPWLTQLAKFSLTEVEFASPQSRDQIRAALEDDAWVFGGLRRRGCAVDADWGDELGSDPGSDADDGDAGDG
jgi:hypothetical protein